MSSEVSRLTAIEPFVRTGAGPESLALSREWAAVGAPWVNAGQGESSGAVFLYRRGAAGWLAHQQATGWDLKPYAQFGRAVAMAGDALVVAAPGLGDGALFFFVRDGDEWRARWRINAPVGRYFFGSSLAAHGDIVLAGSILGSPKVHAYRRAGLEWHAAGEMAGDDPYGNDDFGAAVAYSADTRFALVGAPTANSHDGRVYVFERSDYGSWYRRAVLREPGPEAYDGLFGNALALSGLTALVGSPWAGPGYLRTGRAYLFELGDSGWSHRATLSAPTPGIDDYFGGSVALSGSTAIVAAPSDDTGVGRDTGSVHVFQKQGGTWDHAAELSVPEPTAEQFLGAGVVLDGDTVLTGTPGFTPHGGAGVFRRVGGSWQFDTVLRPVEPSRFDRFGAAVALDGGTLAVGAPDDDPGGREGAGAVYIYTADGSGWAQRARLVAQQPVLLGYFGSAVALAGDTLFVGSPPDVNSGHDDPGRVLVISRTADGTWTQQAVLVPADPRPRQQFGCAVAVSGDTVVVGSRLADSDLGERTGAAYVFTRAGGSWVQQAKLVGSEAQAGEGSATAVAIEGDTIAVGARGHDTAAGRDAGAVYVFTRTGGSWTQQATLTAPTAAARDRLGFSVALSGGLIAAGAPGREYQVNTPGYACLFVNSTSGWQHQATVRPTDVIGARVGSAVALHGGRLLLAATTQRRVYILERVTTGWHQRDVLNGDDGGFGASLATSGNRAAIGAPYGTSHLGASGTALLFDLS